MFAKATLGDYKSNRRFNADLFLESTNDWVVRKQ